MTIRIPITSEAQLSALECRPPGDFEYTHRCVYENDPRRLADALNDASNEEDAWADYCAAMGNRAGARYARAAARALATLYLKACALADHQENTVTIENDPHGILAAGDSVLLNEQAALLRECRFALDSLLTQKPMLAALMRGLTTLGNLRAALHEYRPAGIFGGSGATSRNTL